MFTASPVSYTLFHPLSLHDTLPMFAVGHPREWLAGGSVEHVQPAPRGRLAGLAVDPVGEFLHPSSLTAAGVLAGAPHGHDCLHDGDGIAPMGRSCWAIRFRSWSALPLG